MRGLHTELTSDDSFCSACGKPVKEPEIRGTLAKQKGFQEAIKSVSEESNQTKKDNFGIGTILGFIITFFIILILSGYCLLDACMNIDSIIPGPVS